MELFENNPTPIILDLPDAEILYYPHFFTIEEADGIYQELLEKTPWQQDTIKLFGKTHLQPRLTALYGNENKPYSYSNIKMEPHPWNPLLREINLILASEINNTFTSVLLNLYRDGKDSNGWHADNEKELGKNPVIASLSFGAERAFHLQHNTEKTLKHKIILEHGSLLVMKGTTQHYWKHQIPKTAKEIGNRINLTFRNIY
jgi:alkylated DNA repair dioxygenase AlkB